MNVGNYIYFWHFYLISDSDNVFPSGMVGIEVAGAWHAS